MKLEPVIPTHLRERRRVVDRQQKQVRRIQEYDQMMRDIEQALQK